MIVVFAFNASAITAVPFGPKLLIGTIRSVIVVFVLIMSATVWAPSSVNSFPTMCVMVALKAKPKGLYQKGLGTQVTYLSLTNLQEP